MACRPAIQPNYNRSSKFTDQHKGVLEYLSRLDRDFDQNSARNTDETLYFHQVKAVLKLHKYFNSDIVIRSDANPRNSLVALVVLPTGCGKTGVAVLASYVLNAYHVLVITPSWNISQQIDEAYGDFLIKRGIIGEGIRHLYVPHKMLVRNSEQLLDTFRVHQADLVITNAHKVSDNDNPRAKVKLENIPGDCFDLVIVDEAHHYPAKTWERLVNHFPNSKKIFLTATPEHDGEPILIDPPYDCYKLSRDDAVKGGVIRKVEFNEIIDGEEEERFEVII